MIRIKSGITKYILFLIIAFYAKSFSSQIETKDTFVIVYLPDGDSSSVKCIDSASTLLLSINDFFKALQIPCFVNDTTKKIECLIGTQLIRFTARNPFIVFTERTSNLASVYQLPINVESRYNSFYLPVETFINLFQRITKQQLDFDPQKMKIWLKQSIAHTYYDISDMKVEQKLNGYLITLKANKKLTDYECWLKPDGWLFLTIAGATLDTALFNSMEPKACIKKILTFQSPTSLQITLNVTPDVVQAETSTDPNSNDLLISLRVLSEREKAELQKKQQAQRNSLEEKRNRWKLDVIVIDPGHGGKDPGTIGVNGTKEKDITLAVALKLGNLIEKYMKDVKVVYTRKTDRFVELYRRTQIANEAGGKLFVSIHCNSMPRKPSRANGFEIYLLRPNLTEEAVAVAARENSVIQLEEGYQERYRKLTEEEFILINMAQSAYMKYSEQFAEVAIQTMAKNLFIKNGGVKQAGFYVLVGASMPNVLIELGYLSNRSDEKYLSSHEGQDQIALSLFKSIKQYKTIYEKTLQLETYNSTELD